jgi:hypothetical protein
MESTHTMLLPDLDTLFGFGKFYSLTNSFLLLQMEPIHMMLLVQFNEQFPPSPDGINTHDASGSGW